MSFKISALVFILSASKLTSLKCHCHFYKPIPILMINAIILSSYLLNACTATDPPRIPPHYSKQQSSPKIPEQNTQQHRIHLLSQGLQSAYSVPSHTANRLSPLIIQSADQHGISPFLLAAMIQQESNYKSSAQSSAGAIGLTQVMPQYWQKKCGQDLYNEHTNIQCGSFILSKYNMLAGGWSKALAYYNVGPYRYQSNQKMRQQGHKYAKSVEQHHQNLLNTLYFKSTNINLILNPTTDLKKWP